ncbi:cupredoxin family copper-binding protein [Aeromicrobium sp. Root236]|uniref:cupredoxin domain-containing protein n=1 Tax=Aeromicrobium sp. Root236 TaxID=1736498 RepID=UPI0009EC5081|nr:cupredoxin family copper-binding protein [Aeromicrobium sp. Root236]
MTSTTDTDNRLTPKRWGLMTLVIGGVLTAIVSVAGLSAGASESSDTLTASAATTKAKAAAVAAAATTKTSATATSTKATAAVTKQVMIENYKFSPAALTVAVGDTVKWTNMDTAPHTVTVTSGPVKFNSGNLAKGESFSYTFKTAGTYSYYCAVHPDMTAKVTVTGSSTTPTPTPTPTKPTPTPTGTPTPTPTPTMPPMGGGDDVCAGLESTINVFLQHLYSAHLETSLGQQVTDALNLDQYLKTHLVLVENMLKPLLGGVQSTLDTFLQHVYAAHLETSLGQQVTDALAIDQYVKTHTVLVENMIKPLVGEDLSSC